MRDFFNTSFADPTVDFAFKRIFGTEKYNDATLGLLTKAEDDARWDLGKVKRTGRPILFDYIRNLYNLRLKLKFVKNQL